MTSAGSVIPHGFYRKLLELDFEYGELFVEQAGQAFVTHNRRHVQMRSPLQDRTAADCRASYGRPHRVYAMRHPESRLMDDRGVEISQR